MAGSGDGGYLDHVDRRTSDAVRGVIVTRRPRTGSPVGIIVCGLLVIMAGCVRHPGLPATGTSGFQAKAALTAESATSSVSTVQLALKAERGHRTTAVYLSGVVSDAEDRLEGTIGSFQSVAPPTSAARKLRGRLDDVLADAQDHVATIRIALDSGQRGQAVALIPELISDRTRLERFAT
jgi:hypothetical protein